ncbi:MAG: ORF6N domain-containing protein [Bacteroidales bacterium]|nr:ORF6N domain-containing protein [Bacteroidales bacterium]
MDEINIQNMVHEIRGQQVMLDRNLAQLYGVETKALNQAVRRNIERFPEDFMFELSPNEYNLLIDSSRSQIVTLNKTRGQNIKYAPLAFTEQGVAMLSSVLRSKAAVDINISIMRAFVAARKLAEQFNTVKAEREIEVEDDKKYLLNAFATLEPDLEDYSNTILTLNFVTTRECFLKTILPLVKLYGGKYRGTPGYMFTQYEQAEEAQREINTKCFNYEIPIKSFNNTSRYALKQLGLYENYKKIFNLKEKLYA